jgi:hypothetical protein
VQIPHPRFFLRLRLQGHAPLGPSLLLRGTDADRHAPHARTGDRPHEHDDAHEAGRPMNAERFTTLAHIDEEIALLRNNWDGSDLDGFLRLMRTLHARRQVLLGI